MTDHHHAGVRHLGGWLGAGGLLVAVWCAGLGRLSPPADPGRWAVWGQHRGVVVVAFSGVRLLTLGAGAYLVAVLTIVLVADGCGWMGCARLARLLRRTAAGISPAGLRRSLALGAGLVATGSLAAGCATAGVTPSLAAAVRPAPPPTLARVPPASTATAPPPTLKRVPPASAPAAPPPTLARVPPARTPSTPPPPYRRTAPRRVPVRVSTWTVRPGESFWSIAEARVGGPGRDQVVARYWAALVAANWDRLAVPGDPDLLFVGDEIIVPAPTERGLPGPAPRT